MKFKALLLLSILTLGCQHKEQESESIYTIYLVRHAEKILDTKNPDLTECGHERAKNIAQFLESVDLDVIYSTNYTRTKNTAKPTSESKSLVIENYDPRKLEEFAKVLIDKKENALVVGHSNTTAVLAGLLAGEKLNAFDESIYNRIYQVTIYKNQSKLSLFHSSFSCN